MDVSAAAPDQRPPTATMWPRRCRAREVVFDCYGLFVFDRYGLSVFGCYGLFDSLERIACHPTRVVMLHSFCLVWTSLHLMRLIGLRCIANADLSAKTYLAHTASVKMY